MPQYEILVKKRVSSIGMKKPITSKVRPVPRHCYAYQVINSSLVSNMLYFWRKSQELGRASLVVFGSVSSPYFFERLD
jgi:hypothetical protein